MMYFPSAIVRVNKALPDQVYTSGSHVILSDDDSMFFQWHLRKSKFPSCYIDSVIQIWNVTTPTESMRSLSWNSRPQRIALMDTVPEKKKIEQLRLEDGWQSLMPSSPVMRKRLLASKWPAKVVDLNSSNCPHFLCWVSAGSFVIGLRCQTNALCSFRFDGDSVACVGAC
ncbi:hypothetical protein DFH29DRAFT_934322 [Suillus ampliporus]|nr:hypothetical protein DFH29DRAFT_934322 [Suillus ampliporus]